MSTKQHIRSNATRLPGCGRRALRRTDADADSVQEFRVHTLSISNSNMAFAPELRTHAQKVCSLYKQAMRQVEAYYGQRTLVRYHQVILRARFDQNKCVTDPKDQRRLYWVGENELFETRHPIPCAKLPRSIGLAGGVAAQRVVEPPDWVLDYWHPLEKAQYPEYFKTREMRKAEYICKWQKGELM